ncbi:hypothetical protein C161_27453 [Paenibacillus sp. FSL R5-192]|nr:hypothetical protein C161_27453 [Paenibacillus sp. FSL R5-192]
MTAKNVLAKQGLRRESKEIKEEIAVYWTEVASTRIEQRKGILTEKNTDPKGSVCSCLVQSKSYLYPCFEDTTRALIVYG